MTINYLSLAVREVSLLSPYVPGKSIDELERETGMASHRIIKLASNETPMRPNPHVIQAIQDELRNITRYPDASGFRLKAKLSEKFGLKSEAITLGNGSNDLLFMIAQAFLGAGRNAVFSQHSFSVYEAAAKATGASTQEVLALNWGSDLDQILTAINRETRVIFLANPNNPTGTWFDRRAFEAFIDRVPRETIVVLDEAYIEYADDPSLPNGLDYLHSYPNLIVSRSMCKAYGLAGLRIGFAASSPEVAGILNRVRQPFNVNSLALAGACAALDDDTYLQRGRQVNRQGQQQLQEGLSRLGISWIPSRTNFLAVNFERPARSVYDALLMEGIIVRRLDGYGMPNHLRISVGLKTENIRLLDALGSIMRKGSW
ncbi:aspartate aminotransferase [Hydrogenophaga sp. Root209]|uniref:histidinol-phosphate transaminase n=1 Tax=Hydrogenophaga sp. Root209 TaxID=1736490 RepID=UPI0006FAA5FE|nr:histidinol-phosphate transaminase [Hydrogenophaga sp. Root209]KRC04551.1 aspartate aminotransferase [Hydrogenophaga sp. Root209]